MAINFELVPENWPRFTEEQVTFLEKLYPARCISPRETIEDHIRYAGKVDLIASMREHVPGAITALHLNEDEEDALDDEAIAIVRAGQQEQ